jgi:hypothetical protein
MKQNFFRVGFMALMSATLLISCGKDNTDEDEAVVTPEIILSAPADNATINMATAEYELGITFTWEKVSQITDYLLEVSADQTFASTVASVSGNQDSYLWTAAEIETQLLLLEVDYEQSKVLYWRVKPATIGQEAVTTTRSFTVTRKQHPPKYGEWLFDDASKLEKAFFGNDLKLSGTIKQVDGPNGSDKAVSILGLDGEIEVNHGIKPVGSDKFVNEYTVLLDLKFEIAGIYVVLYHMAAFCPLPVPDPTASQQPNRYILAIEGPGDGISGGNISGISQLWSVTGSDTLDNWSWALNDWHRLVFRFKAEEEMSAWVDGTLRAYARDITQLVRDGSRWVLPPEGFILFPKGGAGGGGNQTTKEAICARMAIWDYHLSEAEIKALGKAGDPTDIGN